MPKKKITRTVDRYEPLRNLLRGAMVESGGVIQTAEVINTSYQTLTRRLREPSSISLGELFSIVDACGVDKDMLFVALGKIIGV